MWNWAADADTNIYLLNQTTLNGSVSFVNANSLKSGYSYVTEAGVNSNDISLNNSYWFVSVYPTLQNATTENYTDYVVIDNTAGSPSTNGTVEASVVYKSYNYASGIKGSSIFLAPVLVIILGFALIIYGLVKKPPEVEEEPTKPNVKSKKKRRSSVNGPPTHGEDCRGNNAF